MNIVHRIEHAAAATHRSYADKMGFWEKIKRCTTLFSQKICSRLSNISDVTFAGEVSTLARAHQPALNNRRVLVSVNRERKWKVNFQ